MPSIRHWIMLLENFNAKVSLLEAEVPFVPRDEQKINDRNAFFAWYKAARETAAHITSRYAYEYRLELVKNAEYIPVVVHVTAHLNPGEPQTRDHPGSDAYLEDVEIQWISSENEQRPLTFDEMFSVWIALETNKDIDNDLQSRLWDYYASKWADDRDWYLDHDPP